MRPIGVLSGQRLGLEDIERGARDVAGIHRGQQIGIHHMAAARAVDDEGTARQSR